MPLVICHYLVSVSEVRVLGGSSKHVDLFARISLLLVRLTLVFCKLWTVASGCGSAWIVGMLCDWRRQSVTRWGATGGGCDELGCGWTKQPLTSWGLVVASAATCPRAQVDTELPIQRPGSGVILCHLYHQDQDLGSSLFSFDGCWWPFCD
ncbi:hypothetical protein O3P69_006654 [Scylla paramamosain]|uniref:Uncharacterized protein n=1 Tax=Scylla paramamosain TaxID=85552 RepID=A0AAW0U1P4_SCYPA